MQELWHDDPGPHVASAYAARLSSAVRNRRAAGRCPTAGCSTSDARKGRSALPWPSRGSASACSTYARRTSSTRGRGTETRATSAFTSGCCRDASLRPDAADVRRGRSGHGGAAQSASRADLDSLLSEPGTEGAAGRRDRPHDRRTGLHLERATVGQVTLSPMMSSPTTTEDNVCDGDAHRLPDHPREELIALVRRRRPQELAEHGYSLAGVACEGHAKTPSSPPRRYGLMASRPCSRCG